MHICIAIAHSFSGCESLFLFQSELSPHSLFSFTNLLFSIPLLLLDHNFLFISVTTIIYVLEIIIACKVSFFIVYSVVKQLNLKCSVLAPAQPAWLFKRKARRIVFVTLNLPGINHESGRQYIKLPYIDI